AVAGVVLAMAACGPDNPAHTQVRIVIQSDLGVPDPIRVLRVINTSRPFGAELVRGDPPLPFLLAVLPEDETRPFSVSVQLSSSQPPADLLLVRNVADARFVLDEARMLVLPMPGK